MTVVLEYNDSTGTDDEAPPSASRHWRRPLLVSAGALVAWLISLSVADVGNLETYGLVSGLSPIIIVAPLVVLGAFATALLRNNSSAVLTAHMTTFIFMLYGAGPMVGIGTQARIAFRHEGVARQILSDGRVDPSIDAYFNWPGFFVATAYADRIADFHALVDVMIWAPVFMNFVYLAPLLVIMRSATSDRIVVWTAVALFYIGNWVGQDYFAPQAVAFALHLTILALLLKHFSVRNPILDFPRDRVGYLAAIIVLFAAMVPTHQLTPPLTLLSVGVLVLVRQCNLRRLPLLFVSMLIAWLVFMSSAYLRGNLAQMLQLVGDLSSAAEANVTSRVAGSAEHQLVVKIRLAFTATLGLLAVIGWFKRRRTAAERPLDRGLTALIAAPALLILLQPYGGEMVLRVSFFTLPFVAFFAANVLELKTLSLGRRPFRTFLTCTAAAALLGLFFVARYGNAALDQYSVDERAVVQQVYEEAEPGAMLLVLVENVPWKNRDYTTFDHQAVERHVTAGDDAEDYVDTAISMMYEQRDDGAYFIATESQQSYIDVMGGTPRGTLALIEETLREDPNIELIIARESIRVWELSGGAVES